MGQPAAKRGDRITATDTHAIQPPGPSSPIFAPHLFNGIIDDGLSSNVKINGQWAAMVGSTASNTPTHIPSGGTFIKQPSNQGRIVTGSMTVMINGKQAARNNDSALTCNDPIDLPVGTVVAAGTVMIG